MKAIRFPMQTYLGMLLVFLLLLAGCGGSDGASGGDEPAGSDATEPGDADGGEDTDATEPEGDGEPTGSDVPGESISLTLAFPFPEAGTTWTEWMSAFFVPELERRTAEETNHELDLNVSFGGTIAPAPEVLGAVRDGLADIGGIPNPVFPADLFLHQLPYYVPFGTSDPTILFEALRKTMDANPIMFTQLEEDFNQKLLAFGGYGSYDVFTTFPLDSIDDLEGRKIGAVGPNARWVTVMGGVPVDMLLPEAYNALQTGLYEGLIMLPGGVAGFNLEEVGTHHTRARIGAIWSPLITVNLDTYNALPEDFRQILDEVALEYERTMPPEILEDEQEALDKLEAAGIEIGELSEDDIRRWAEAIGNLPNQRAQEGNDLGLPASKVIRDFMNFQTELGHEFPVEWEIED